MAIYTHREVAGSPSIWWGNETRSGNFTVTPTLVIVPAADGTETRYVGTGLSFSNNTWTGTITSVSHTNAGGSVVYEDITGFSIAAASFISATNVSTALSLIFDGADTLNGFSGNDTLISYNGDDTLIGGFGNNSYQGRGGNDTLIGSSRGLSGVDFDTAVYNTASAGIVVTLTGGIDSTTSTVTGDSSVGTDTLTNIEGIRGTNFADTITVTNTFVGSFGTFAQIEGGGGNDIITGNGNTRVSYQNALAGVTVNLFTGVAQSTASGDAAGVGVDQFTGVNQVRGSGFADNLSAAGGRGNFFFEGGAGNDTLTGTMEGINNFDFNQARYDNGATAAISVSLGATSTVTGDASVGTDTLVNVEGVRGTAFADTFVADSNFVGQFGHFNVFEGLGGNDTITGSGFTAVGYNNALAGVRVNLQVGVALSVPGSDGAGIGVDNIVGGVNTVHGSAFDDVIIGSDGIQAERFRAGAGSDSIDGGGGSRNSVEYRPSPSGVVVNLMTGVATDGFGGTDTLIRIQDASGSEFNDTLIGDNNVNYLVGQSGNDALYGFGGDDILVGDDDANLYSGAFGVSTVFDSGNDVLDGGAGADTLYGGVGFDYASYSSAAAGIRASLIDQSINLGDAAGDIYYSIEALQGSNFADVLIGTTGANVLRGEGGDDALVGAGGSDTLLGGAGNDDYYIVSGTDIIIEATDEGVSDRVFSSVDYSLASNVELLYMQTGAHFGGGNDTDNVIVGTTGDDVLSGASGADQIVLYGGNDTAYGGIGDDTFYVDSNFDTVIESAGQGIDRVFSSINYVLTANVEYLYLNGSAVVGIGNELNNAIGGNSLDNVLSGGAGNDELYGGAGNDTFVFRTGYGNDIIGDFAAGPGFGDVIQLDPSLASNFAAVMTHASQVGSNTLLTFDGSTSLLILNVLPSGLNANDFSFA